MAETVTQPDFSKLPPHYEEAWQRWLNTPISGGLAPKDLMLTKEIRIAYQGFMAGMFAGEQRLELKREHVVAYKEAYDRCEKDPDDDLSPEWRGLEAVFRMTMEGHRG